MDNIFNLRSLQVGDVEYVGQRKKKKIQFGTRATLTLTLTNLDTVIKNPKKTQLWPLLLPSTQFLEILINSASLCSQQKVNYKSLRLCVDTVNIPSKTGAMLLPIKPESPRRMQRQRIISIVFWNSFQASVADANVVLEQNRARCVRMKSSHRNGHSNLWKWMNSLTTKKQTGVSLSWAASVK